MHQAQIHAESVLFVCPALSFVKSPLHFHHAALQGGHFVFWFRIPPGLNLSEIHARGRGGLQPGTSRDSIPPWGRPKAGRAARTSSRRSSKADWATRTSSRRSAKADRPARTSSRRSAKADCATRTSPRRSAKADCPARSLPRRSAKVDNGGRLCPGGLFRPRGRPERRASL